MDLPRHTGPYLEPRGQLGCHLLYRSETLPVATETLQDPHPPLQGGQGLRVSPRSLCCQEGSAQGRPEAATENPRHLACVSAQRELSPGVTSKSQAVGGGGRSSSGTPRPKSSPPQDFPPPGPGSR